MAARRRRAVLVTVLIVVLVAVAVARWQVRAGISAQGEPTVIEKFVARSMRSFAIPAGAKEVSNPLERTEEVLVSAQEEAPLENRTS